MTDGFTDSITVLVHGDFFNQGEVEMKKSSIFKLEKILFFLSGQVVQLSRYTFFRFVDLNGLGWAGAATKS